MSSISVSPFKKLWFMWKSLRLPWRKRFLVGFDLQGNTFWEFRNSLSSHQHRMRRIIKYKRSVHNSDVQISPQWHQWLRHTRADAPSMTELCQDIVRQEQLKVLAAAADAKWTKKSKLLDRSGCSQDQCSISLEDRNLCSHHVSSSNVATSKSSENTTNSIGSDGVRLSSLTQFSKYEVDPRTSIFTKSSDSTTETLSEDPWKNATGQGLRSNEWQPKSWDPILHNGAGKSNDSHTSKITINDKK